MSAGTWKDLTDNVNFMAGNLTSQVRNIADVTNSGGQWRPCPKKSRWMLKAKFSN